MTDTEKRQDSQVATALPSAGTPTEVVSSTSLQLQQDLVKAVTPAGAFMTDDHRYYFNGEGPVPSVTTVLEVLDKPDLTYWKVYGSLRKMYQEIERWPERSIMVGGQKLTEDEAVLWAYRENQKTADQAAKIGSGVHILADMATRADRSDSKAFGISDEVRPYLEAYRAFSDRYERSSFVSSEKVVWSLNGYAGTYDLLMMIDGELWLIDIKTGKGLYPEFALQLAGYRWADWIILPGNPQHYDMPNVDRTGILHLRPDLYPEQGYKLWEYPTTYEAEYMTFLGLLEAWKWKQRKVKPIDRSHKDF